MDRILISSWLSGFNIHRIQARGTKICPRLTSTDPKRREYETYCYTKLALFCISYMVSGESISNLDSTIIVMTQSAIFLGPTIVLFFGVHK